MKKVNKQEELINEIRDKWKLNTSNKRLGEMAIDKWDVCITLANTIEKEDKETRQKIIEEFPNYFEDVGYIYEDLMEQHSIDALYNAIDQVIEAIKNIEEDEKDE